MNARQRGHLNKSLPFSLVDGPGNRFVLFLQGCNFNCIGCHNPYTIDVCNGCGLCINDCPEFALSLGPQIKPDVDRSLCTDCEICVQVCPYDSTPLSWYVTVEEMIEEIRVVSAYISGVTVSGGEATLQAHFVRDLFTAIKSDPELSHLTTFIDSNGSAGRATWDLLAPVTDQVMVDLKALDPQVHMELTGNSNTAVLESIRYLAEINMLYEVRLLIVPGFNDSQESVSSTAKWLRSIDPAVPLKVMGHRTHGTRPIAAKLAEPSHDDIVAIGDRFRSEGFANVTVI